MNSEEHFTIIEEPTDEEYAISIAALRCRLQNRADSTRALFELTKEVEHPEIINDDSANVRVVSVTKKASEADEDSGMTEDGTVLLTIDDAYNEALDAAQDLVRFDMIQSKGDIYFLEHLECDDDDDDDEDEDD